MRIILLVSLLFMEPVFSQGEHPFRQIDSTAATYTANNILIRMMDGMGFRYYWATAGIKDKDLEYRPSAEGRNLLETLQHLHGLSRLILLTSQKQVNQPVTPPEDLEALRKETLDNLWEARMNLSAAEDFGAHTIRFNNESEFAFWNLIHGPISDVIWHSGQVVLLRRANGNPLPQGVSLFRGTYKKPTSTQE